MQQRSVGWNMVSSSLRKNRSFICLTAAQFLGATNDNLFKTVVSLYAIRMLAESGGSSYLSLAGALFAIPYLVFAGYAGYLADIASKRTVLVICKFAEVVIMGMGLVALAHADRIEGLLLVLFLMAAHATFFNPAKYGSVPELVTRQQLTRANGILEATRYAAIIIGSVAGGFLMEIWREAPVCIGVATVAIALVGLLCSIGIHPLTPATRGRGWPHYPWTTPAAGFSRICQSRSLVITVASLVIFDAIASLVLLDILLIAKNELGLNDAAAGATSGLLGGGMVSGALLCSASRTRGGLGITPIAGFGMAATLLTLALRPHNYVIFEGLLFLLGTFAGLFVVPFVAWLQRMTRHDEKGLVISTASFAVMAAGLGASPVLWCLHDQVGLTPSAILAVAGGAMALYMLTVLALWQRLASHVRLFLRSIRPLLTYQ